MLRMFQLLVAGALLGAITIAQAKPVESQSGADGITITDTQGRTIHLDAPVTRLAACSSFSLETLMDLGVRPVARFAVPPIYPPQAEDIPVVARSHGTGPDVEQLVAAQADAILLHDVFHAFADSIEKATGTPVILHRVDSVEDVRSHIAMVADLTGTQAAGEAMVANIDQALARVETQRGPEPSPRALSLFGTNDAWYAHLDNAFMGDLLKHLGATNVAAGETADTRYRSLAPVDVEQLITLDPEVIFVIQYNGADDTVVDELVNHPAFQALAAVRNGRVHVLDGPIYTSHAGPRVAQALTTLNAYLYPDQDATTAP